MCVYAKYMKYYTICVFIKRGVCLWLQADEEAEAEAQKAQQLKGVCVSMRACMCVCVWERVVCVCV